jgi:integrase
MPPNLRVVGGIGPAGASANSERRSEPGIRNGKDRLSDTRIRAARPRSKPYKLTDGAALYVLISPTGAKLWRLKYRFVGAEGSYDERSYSIGAYPEVTIVKARAARDQARDWLRDGLDPNVQRRVEHSTVAAAQAMTFAAVCEEWFAAKSRKWSANHRDAQRRLLARFVLPSLGALPFASVEAPHLLECLSAIERRGAHELLAKTRQILGQVCRYGIAKGRRTTDPSAALKGAFERPPVINRATVPAAKLPALFKALHAVPAELTTKLALYFQIATGVRPGEVRFATWGEVDHAKKLWRIGARRMKMRRDFVQPLSPLAIDVLKRAAELRQTRDPGELIFPGFTRTGHLSENAFTALLARAGFYGRQTAHGFRSAFRTWAGEWEPEDGKGEKEFDPVAVELCLAHRPAGVAGIYNRGEYLPARRRILGHWAEHLVECGLRLP